MYSPFSLFFFLFSLLGFMHTSILGAGDPIATKAIYGWRLYAILSGVFWISCFSLYSLLVPFLFLSALNGIYVRGGFSLV